MSITQRYCPPGPLPSAPKYSLHSDKSPGLWDSGLYSSSSGHMTRHCDTTLVLTLDDGLQSPTEMLTWLMVALS